MRKSAAQRFKEHSQRRKAQGLIRRTFWIPASQSQAVKNYIETLTNKEQTK